MQVELPKVYVMSDEYPDCPLIETHLINPSFIKRGDSFKWSSGDFQIVGIVDDFEHDIGTEHVVTMYLRDVKSKYNLLKKR